MRKMWPEVNGRIINLSDDLKNLLFQVILLQILQFIVGF